MARRPTPDEAALWRLATKDVKPVRKRGRERIQAPKSEVATPAPAPAKTVKTTKPAAPPAPPAPKPAPAAPITAIKPVGHVIPGLDRASARRLATGRAQIGARLDLHGLDQATAHHALNGFVRRAVEAGHTTVLVITGKGERSGGILRTNLPRWLAEAPNRAHVLAILPARPQHGGQGAFYVRLRRRREPD
jgi:DNA-nicking Smr family endonuclease